MCEEPWCKALAPDLGCTVWDPYKKKKKMLGGRKPLPRSSGLVLVFGLFFTSPVAQLFLSFDPCCILLLPAESQLTAVPCWFPPAAF